MTDARNDWVEKLHTAIDTTLSSSDPEGPHRVRKAIARLLVGLELDDRPELVPELRRLRRRAGRVRDIDIQLSLRPQRRWRERLRLRRARRNERLVKTLQSKRTRRLLDALKREPPGPETTGRSHIRALAKIAWKHALEMSDAPDDMRRAHALRRHVRRLRFALEWTGRTVTTLAGLQHALGTVCDTSAALDDIERRRDRRGLRRFRKRLERRRRTALGTAHRSVLGALPTLEALTIWHDEARSDVN